MKSTYSKTGNRPGKPGFRTQASFVKRFFNKIRLQKVLRKRKLLKFSYFNKNNNNKKNK